MKLREMTFHGPVNRNSQVLIENNFTARSLRGKKNEINKGPFSFLKITFSINGDTVSLRL